MTNIAVVGAGEMGRATLRILARRLPEARFTICDRDAANLAKATALAPERISPSLRDVVSDPPDLDGSTLVANFAGPFYHGSDAVARAALEARCAYVDICDDVEGIHPILALHDEAERAGVALITGAGNSPGTSNMMARHLLELDPECDGIRIVWVVADPDPGGLAPLRHMLHMAVAPCPVWRDGAFVDEAGFVPRTALEHDLPEIGRTTAYNTAHSEPITLARMFPALRYAGVQGALRPHWANEVFSALGRLGFGRSDLRVEVGGQEIDPAEVLWKVLWARHGSREPAQRDPGLTIVQVQALSGGDVRRTMSIVDPHSMARTTAIGAAAAILSVLERPPVPGAWGTEILEPEPTLALVEALAGEEGAIPGGFVIAE